jgi:thymidylate synthase
MMMAQATGLKPGEFVHTLGDAHIYLNHMDQVEEQLSRTPRQSPRMELNSERTDIFGWNRSDFKLVEYDAYPSIKAPIAV